LPVLPAGGARAQRRCARVASSSVSRWLNCYVIRKAWCAMRCPTTAWASNARFVRRRPRASFIPPQTQRHLRDLTRYRTHLITVGIRSTKRVYLTSQGKLGTPVCADVLRVVGFAVPIVRLVKLNQDRHDCAFDQVAAAHSLDLPAVQQPLAPGGGKRIPKIIYITKQFKYTHRGIPLSCGWFTRKLTAFSLREVSSYPELRFARPDRRKPALLASS
jgi:hypothetical protein